MRTTTSPTRLAACGALAAALLLPACGGGPRIEARPQVITFGPAPVPAVNQASVTVAATASSGLPVRYASRTPATCAIGASSGVVTAAVTGTCTVAASQDGDARWAAARPVTQDVAFTFSGVITFGATPVVAVHDLATVTASESAGAPVAFASATPVTCGVEAATGLVAALAAGPCTVDATAGSATASLTFEVAPAGPSTSPGAPIGAAAVGSADPAVMLVRVAGVSAGGNPILGYTVTSSPAGFGGTGATLPVAVACPAPCTGVRFAVAATTAAGDGPASAPGNLTLGYRVLATFREPDTQPNDSIFEGTFDLDASAGIVSGLSGRLSESMTGGPVGYPDDTMVWVPLSFQRSALAVTLDGAAGRLVTAFHLDSTDTFTDNPILGGTDGWSPGSGNALHAGFPGANPGNAYVRIFVSPADPTAPPTRGQLDWLAYADCAPGGMMGATCMTGTTVAAYGTVGSMGGFPAAQVITRR